MNRPGLWTVAQVLRETPLPVLDARVLLAHVLEKPVVWLLSHGDEGLTEVACRHFEQLVARRLRGEPVAYLTGEKEFWGLRFEVTPDVLVPRADTETLVAAALDCIPPGQRCRVLDLGTGSGALAIALVHERREIQVCGCDRSPATLRVAQANACRLLNDIADHIRWLESDWYTALPVPQDDDEKFDVIVSNPPYVADGDTHLNGDVRFEPRSALVSGADGLDDLRTIVQGAPAFLRPGGTLLVEHGYDQSTVARELLTGAGFTATGIAYDLAGIARVAWGR